MEHQEAVILVVGAEKERHYKACLANALAEARGAAHVHTTKAGARFFSLESSSAPVVVDTTVLVAYNDWYLADSAAAWASANSIRQMHNKVIYVVCVVTSTGPNDPVHHISEIGDMNPTWLNVLSFIFDQHLLEVMVLLQLEGTNSDTKTKMSGVVDVLSSSGFSRDNIRIVTFTRENLQPTVELVLETSCLYPGNNLKGKWGKSKSARIAPFLVREVPSGSKRTDWYGPWGPSPVILFGRTGSGKSTLAQMLTQGSIDPQSKQFVASSSIRGETTKLNAGQGRGWYVVDTPGFGEPDNSESSVSTQDAEKKLKRYVKRIQGMFSHFLYVVMKDRMDQLEINLWKFFVLLFGDDISTNFTVVISNADQSWVEENKAHLQTVYAGCESFLSAEFPPMKTDDEEWEAELEEVRTGSLCQLEEELASLFRFPTPCDFGLYSKGSTDRRIAEFNLDVLNARDHLVKKAAALAVAGAARSFVGVRRLMMTLESEEKLLLLPRY